MNEIKKTNGNGKNIEFIKQSNLLTEASYSYSFLQEIIFLNIAKQIMIKAAELEENSIQMSFEFSTMVVRLKWEDIARKYLKVNGTEFIGNKDEVLKALQDLRQMNVNYINPRTGDFDFMNLITRISGKTNQYIDVELPEKAFRMFLGITNRYGLYSLKYIFRLQKKYSKRWYMLANMHKYKGRFSYSIEAIQKMFGLDKPQGTKAGKKRKKGNEALPFCSIDSEGNQKLNVTLFFENVILEPLEELNTLSDYNVLVEPIRDGRTIVGYEFEVKNKMFLPETGETPEDWARVLEHIENIWKLASWQINLIQRSTRFETILQIHNEIAEHLRGTDLRDKEGKRIKNVAGYVWRVFKERLQIPDLEK